MSKINYKFLIDQIAEQRAKIHNLEHELDQSFDIVAQQAEEIDALKMELYQERPIFKNGTRPFYVV